jgi:hypothetical protein
MLGRGSVILIKGKPEKGKRRLYITTIDGFTEFRPGVKMVFLNQDFHRVVMGEQGLRATPVAYRNEPALKSQLNLKSPGRISVVLNNNKTPLHWITTKHLSFTKALNAVQSILLGEDHLFENAESTHDAETKAFNRFVMDTINTLYYGKNLISVLKFNVDDAETLAVDKASDQELDSVNIEWSISIEAVPDPSKYSKEIVDLQLDSTFTLDIDFLSDVRLSSEYDPGDHWNPSYEDWTIDATYTEYLEFYIDGSQYDLLPETTELITKISGEFSDHFGGDFETLFKKNIKGTASQLLMALSRGVNQFK